MTTPTDTQRAPTLTQCIEREREADALRAFLNNADRLNDSRSAVRFEHWVDYLRFIADCGNLQDVDVHRLRALAGQLAAFTGPPNPTPARSEADTTEWGEPKPDCPRCHGTGTYRSLLGARLRTRLLACPCGLSDPARSEAAGGEEVTRESVRLAVLNDPKMHAAYTVGRIEEHDRMQREMDSLRQQLAAARSEPSGEDAQC